MIKYKKWLDNNTHLLTNKLAIVVGATGSIGKATVEYLLELKAKVILACRNISKALEMKTQLLLKYPKAIIYVEEVDVSSLKSIDEFQLNVDAKYPKVDIFISEAGIYHQKLNVLSADGFEMHFATNALGNYYLAKKIIFDLKSDAKMIFVSSLAYNFSKVNFKDIQSSHVKSKMKIYANSKRILTFLINNLKLELIGTQISINLVHPGVCATSLFNGGHSFLFMHTIHPLMKVIFHNPYKASLSAVRAIFVDTNVDQWIGPRGLFHAWGYPKTYKLAKDMSNPELCKKVNSIVNTMICK